MVSKDSKIIVVGGAGTMGSSTALHLARRGFVNVRVMDMFQPPSGNSAGNDRNKLISTHYVDGIWGRLAFETWEAWQSDPLFQPFLHPVGRVDIASSKDAPRAQRLRKQLQRSTETGRGTNVEWLDDEQAILQKAPYLHEADIKGWTGMWTRNAGWVAARDALNAVGHELRTLGVFSTFGTSGTFKEPLLAEDGTTVVGVRAVDGTEWPADLVVMATGAWSPTLIDLQDQCTSKCWQYGHVRLSEDEVSSYKGQPTLYAEEVGFFMEPSPDGVMKFVNEFQGYTRLAKCQPFGSKEETVMSVPRSHGIHPTDTIPTEGLESVKEVISRFAPALKSKELFDTAICWCTDSFDGNWLLCEHPKYHGLILATGDSGHTFKMLPIVGKYVADLIEGKLSDDDRQLWKWRPEMLQAGVQGRDGPPPKDLNDLDGWRHDRGPLDNVLALSTHLHL